MLTAGALTTAVPATMAPTTTASPTSSGLSLYPSTTLAESGNHSFHLFRLEMATCVLAAGASSTAVPATTAAPGGLLIGVVGALTPAPTTTASPTSSGVFGFHY